MNTPLPNYRIYDRTATSGGVTHDIHADTLEAAIEAGRKWVAEGDWSGGDHDDSDCIARVRTIELECEVGRILYRPQAPDVVSLDETVRAYAWEWLDRDKVWVSHISQADLVADSRRLCSALGGAMATVSIDAHPDADGWRQVSVYCRREAGWPIEIDVAATELADRHDCTYTYTDAEPDCPVDEGWDFVGTHSAGLDDFGCRGHDGTRMTHYEVCRNTGIYRDTLSAGSQRNPGEPTEIVTYRERDARSEAYVVKHHTDEHGFLPEWLATYLERSLSTRMTEEQAKEWVTEHTDDDKLDTDELEHAFAAIFGRRADDQERAEGLWSHVNACVDP